MVSGLVRVPFARYAKGGVMRLFSLFLRRAGVQATPVALRKPASSRLTVVCDSRQMASVRRFIYKSFQGAGLKVVSLQVGHATDPNLVSSCVTVTCPPEMRPVLMKQARELARTDGVRDVRWGDHRHIVLN